MRGFAGLVAYVLVGCNWAFDLGETELKPFLDAQARPDGDPRVDNDRDGIKDVVDDCIAADTDLLVDTDGDGMINNVDPCAFIMAATADSDGDGIGDACDPFPKTGDRVRCVMAFTDPELDSILWHAREDAASWTLSQPRELIGRAAQGIVTDWPFEGAATTTYEIVGRVIDGKTGAFSVFVRGAQTTMPDEAGCAIEVSATGWSLSMIPPLARSDYQVPLATAHPYRMTVTIAPAAIAPAANLRCTLQVAGGATIGLATHVELPVGTLAFVTAPVTTVEGIAIYERDDAPAL